jgi:DNA-directed RNA polymerase subunit RPC12/RpoP
MSVAFENSMDQYGPDAVNCPHCGKRTYGDADAYFCVQCGRRLRGGQEGSMEHAKSAGEVITVWSFRSDSVGCKAYIADKEKVMPFIFEVFSPWRRSVDDRARANDPPSVQCPPL